MYGFAAEPPAPALLQTKDGLTYLSPEARQAIQAALQAAALNVPATHGYLTFDVEPSVGAGGWDALQGLVASGFVAMVEQAQVAAAAFKVPRIRFSRNPLVVEESAGPGGTFAIVAGPSFVLSTAEVGVKVPGPTWVFPAVVAGGVAALIWLIRR